MCPANLTSDSLYSLIHVQLSSSSISYLCHKLLLLSFNDCTEFKFLILVFVFLIDQSLSSLLDHLRINSSTDIGSMIISEAGQGNLEKLKELLRVHPDKV